jgi:hypothetical protein
VRTESSISGRGEGDTAINRLQNEVEKLQNVLELANIKIDRLKRPPAGSKPGEHKEPSGA